MASVIGQANDRDCREERERILWNRLPKENGGKLKGSALTEAGGRRGFRKYGLTTAQKNFLRLEFKDPS